MKGLLHKAGYDNTDDPALADLFLLVTCSIREKAVNKVYSDLGRIRPYIEDKPHAIVGLAGCVAQQEKGEMFKRFPFLDMVFGPDAIKELPSMVEKIKEKKMVGLSERVLQTQFHSRKDFEFVNLLYDGEENKIKAFVNIQKGCDNICSFCIVPHVRGREVSRPSSQIIDEIKALVDMGVKEVTLLGQNVNSYGLKDTGEVTFAKLLEKIANETQIKRLRFTTSHPKDVGPDLIEQYKNLDILCPSFHLPVQSGSNSILKAMRRFYTREEYLEKIARLREVRPTISFTSDIIVGFPGETDEDFAQTLDLLDQAQFDLTYSFLYSPRPYTTAVKLEDNVPREIKSKRLDILLEHQRAISRKLNEKMQDCVTEVLVESIGELGQNYMGRTDTYKIVHFKSETPKNLLGQIVPVRITKTQPHSLIGELANEH